MTIGSPSCGIRSAERSGRKARWARASSTSATASAVAWASASVARRRHNRDRERAGIGREARGGIDQMVEPAAGAEPPRVASGGRDAAAGELERSGQAARRPRIRDVDAPRPTLGGDAPDGDVSAQIDERAGQRRPGRPHRLERARRREALADAAEVDRCALLEARPSGAGSTSTRDPACQPSSGRGARSVSSSNERS